MKSLAIGSKTPLESLDVIWVLVTYILASTRLEFGGEDDSWKDNESQSVRGQSFLVILGCLRHRYLKKDNDNT